MGQRADRMAGQSGGGRVVSAAQQGRLANIALQQVIASSCNLFACPLHHTISPAPWQCQTGDAGGNHSRRCSALPGTHRHVVCLWCQDVHQLPVDVVGIAHACHYRLQQSQSSGGRQAGVAAAEAAEQAPNCRSHRRCKHQRACDPIVGVLAAVPAPLTCPWLGSSTPAVTSRPSAAGCCSSAARHSSRRCSCGRLGSGPCCCRRAAAAAGAAARRVEAAAIMGSTTKHACKRGPA